MNKPQSSGNLPVGVGSGQEMVEERAHMPEQGKAFDPQNKERKGPKDRRGCIGNLERPEFQLAHARHQRHGAAEGPQETAQEYRPSTEAVKEMQAFFQLVFVVPERPDMQDLVVIMKPDPV